MNYTKEEYKWLSQYEEHFHTALFADWARGIGSTATAQMTEIYNRATGNTRRTNAGCGVCVLSLLKDAGRLWYADKEAKAKRSARTPKQ